MEDENLYDKIRELFGNIPDNFSILEEEIDIDLQLEYFEYSRKHRGDTASNEILSIKEILLDHSHPVEERRKLLVQLASIEDVDAYRMIEKYLQKPEPELRDWAVLALQESRMLLESKLLDENQVFISTGLGGKENKLRYFVVIISKEALNFTEFHMDIIKKEFKYVLKKHYAYIEELLFFKNFATLVVLIPLELSLKAVFKDAIKECNQFGDFLSSHFIITNVKKLSKREILEFLEDHKTREELKASGRHIKPDNVDDSIYDEDYES